ncbi:MAG: L-2-hydroxyglutarate oxidase [Saprospiraceae bacterium]|nr:L-2-hydroxyglutarate oxidase [Saprospiraceae bacterium]
MKYDIVIVGAGIVGLATAYRISQKNPRLSLCILEKENTVAAHQTGHNSGVIHSGIYYKPGSLKALNCKKGYDELLVFAKEYGIKHDVCGKVIVATKEAERPLLDNIFKRGIANGMQGIRKISPKETKEIEPYVNAVESIWVPQTGIIDYVGMSKKLAELIEGQGHKIFFKHKVKSMTTKSDYSVVHTEGGDFEAKLVISCAGLYADKVTKMLEPQVDFHVLPFRGEYYEIVPNRQYLVKNLIYPVPNPNFPFLGVHFTRMAKGGVEAGPNAVLSYRREGYSRWDVHFGELFETLSYKGFRKIAAKYWREGLDEMYRSYSKSAFVRALQNLIPEIGEDDLVEGGSGVRAQACDSGGNLVDDFWFIENQYVINVCNAPSPAATACLAVGETVADKALKRF